MTDPSNPAHQHAGRQSDAPIEVQRPEPAELSRMRRELDAARRVAEHAVSMLEAIRASTSWSLTRPLRVVSERLRGRRWREPASPSLPWATPSTLRARTGAEESVDTSALVERLAFPTAASPRVSIIVPTYGKLGVTARCLRSIQEHASATSFEVIVVEDRSNDPDIGRLSAVPGLVYRENASNLGFLRSCNEAVNSARGEYICFLNNDTEVTAGWLDALLDIHERFPDCGIAGAKLLFPDGSLQEAGGIIWADGSGWNFGRGRDPRAPEFNYVREVDYCSGAALLLRTELFKDVGRFDERYAPAYYEDADLAFRIREGGLKVYYCPRSEVVHIEGVSHGTGDDAGIKSFQARNRKVFRARWRHVLDRDHYRNGDRVFRAREHARHKPVVLVTDHMVPQPDRDAGSRAMLQTMLRLVAMGMVVKFWPNDRIYDPRMRHLLDDAGVEIVAGDSCGGSFEAYVRDVGQELDFALLSRPNFAEPYLSLLREYSRAHIVFYGHDIHHRRMLAQAEVTGDPQVRRAAVEMRGLEESIWLQVDSIIYPSREEAGLAAAFAGEERVHSVPLYCFGESELTFPVPDPDAVKILFVAGFGHPPNEDAAEWLASEILPRVQRALPNATLWLVGSNPTARVRALAARGVRIHANVSSEELEAHYRDASVAIAPLRFGGGVKLKVVEAMARGVPIVTTSVGAQGLDAVGGALAIADDAQALAALVVNLAQDPALARRTALAAHDYLRENYSESAMEQALARAFNAVEGVVAS
ncbi:glycosyltransferase [Cognatilysobacter lacus]|uniref:Glycosyltransferase n=1 Tax=Cognatilysobacter lacus TaxID=1643323 RepID=A0A5D8ZAN7_9GAMM|nr:glycosyltransferase [Lysobacter lacus]TZF91192.1 glycosyltransferase [Lysobacter lacus]